MLRSAVRASTGLPVSVIAAAYLLGGSAWLVFARNVVPSLVAAAHEGRSLPLLNAHLGPRLPLEYYLERWIVASNAVLLAGLVHVCVLLVLVWLHARRANRSPDAETRPRLRTNRTLLGFSLAFLVVTALSGVRHDYFVHVEIWESVLQGANPWLVEPGQSGPVNAYGPLFNALAVLVPINELAPKLLLATAYLLFVIWLVKIVGPRHGRRSLTRVAVLAWIVNPLPWMEVAYNGHFDILVGLLCVAAIQARRRGADVWSGAMLGLGALLKFLPVVILPFLAVERRRIRFSLILATVATMAAGAVVSVLLWGSSVVSALSYTVVRRSDLLSIFRFLRGEWSPLRPFMDAATVDAMAAPVLAVAGLLVFAWSWRRSVDPAKGAVLAVLTTVMFYHVGYVQYRFVLFVLVSYWCWTRQTNDRANDRFLSLVTAVYFGSLALFDVFYTIVGGVILEGTRWDWIQEIAGAPTFLMEAALLIAVMRSSSSSTSTIPLRP